ncbi:MAG: hypothetical protein KGH57_00030 [Candidatus Micrarchaeota archaeon]|nr:hypothetical protein [Candidatus Micrarchaeota archaeon]
MQKLSLLVFSKDDTEQALETIRDSYSTADDIVLMDASGDVQKSWIKAEKNKLKLSRLRIFDVIALGYREPLMMYALKKCRNRWVLALNTDERMSARLKESLPKLLNVHGRDAYSIPLYSIWSKNSRTFVSSQARLFRKDRIEFRGLLHEKPIVHGRLKALSRDDCIEHMTAGMEHTAKDEYAEMERFERYTYAQHNKRLLDQLDRVRGMDTAGKIKLSAGKRAMLGLLRIYESLGLKSREQEVSNFDYYLFWLVRTAAHQARRRSLRGVVGAFPGAAEYAREMKEWRSGPHGNEDFEIAKQISKMGVTKYLGLDNEHTVESLNKKYRNRKQGVSLLIKLLRENYMKSGMKKK